ncbi:MAG TPA: phage baseplate protein [Verrucomicrobiae bacterium]|nr:phage baseplate protein [Verrucomicrobiae bacterium]
MMVWELGASQPWDQRALALLAVACAGDEKPEQLAQLSIGQRDACLLTLRERMFGPQLAAVAPCPVCDELLEFGIKAAEIRATPAVEPTETMDLSHTDYEVRFRLPNSLDMTSLDPKADNQKNRQCLLTRCVLFARRAGAEITSAELPPEVVAAVAERMAKADPQADLQLALACPKCAHRWQVPLDILSFFWSEINAWAIRLLHDVHVLASAYGWREADILSMSPKRRQAYMELVQP